MTQLTRGGFALPGTSTAFKTGTWRVQRPMHHHRPAPCHTACPAGEDAQAYLAKVEEGQPQLAWELLAAANPLTASIHDFLIHSSLPVDVRHNAKIFREQLAVWAASKLR